MPDGAIRDAEVGLGDSVIMASDDGEEYKPMQSGIHLYVEDCDASIDPLWKQERHLLWNQRTSSMVIEVQIYIRLICTTY
jgi:uncharacterized glyoxalase superfamily protein PhnB